MLLSILSQQEKEQFDTPPRLVSTLKQHCFDLPPEAMALLSKLRTPTNKVGFVLQYGYFIATQRFYPVNRFPIETIKYVTKLLGFKQRDVNMMNYKKKIPGEHQHKILTLCHCKSFNDLTVTKVIKKQLNESLANYAEPHTIFMQLLQWLHENNIEIPTYHTLAELITEGYRRYEKKLINYSKKKLTKLQIDTLESLLNSCDGTPTLFNQFKYINASTAPKAIKAQLALFEQLQAVFLSMESIILEMPLSTNARRYYANWVKKAKISQLQQFPIAAKRYFHLLLFIQDQYYRQQDALVVILIKCIQTAKNTASKEKHKPIQPKEKESINILRKARLDKEKFINSVKDIVQSSVVTPSGKLSAIEDLIVEYDKQFDDARKANITQSDDILDNIDHEDDYYESLIKGARRLHNRVGKIIQLLQFDADTSDDRLYHAITKYQECSGSVNSQSPTGFLSKKQKNRVKVNGKVEYALYKTLLYFKVAECIKSGELNLKYSYQYRAIQDYLLSKDDWNKKKDRYLRQVGLSEFTDPNAILNKLQVLLDDQYHLVNQNYNDGNNPYLTLRDDLGVGVNTPAVDNKQDGLVGNMLANVNYVSLLQILTDINQATNFTNALKHTSIKHTKLKPTMKTFLAGIIAQGCNIGIEKLAHTSEGILESTLKNTVNWCFTLKNLRVANNRIVAMIEQLSLSGVYLADPGKLHSSSDGRKVGIALDSLISNYSFKYFGKDKGCSVYTFIDERQSIFYSTVFSAAEREAAYVIDGLLNNDVVQPDYHSTDMHGFTESIFGASYFIKTDYAPRFKNISKQTLYGLSSPKNYAKNNYTLKPKSQINKKLIINNWDDILRFMTTILLKQETASRLFKRLSSYAKANPLYKALKEFGRIIKSMFILRYYDDVNLRQRITKQLNRIELSNKFGRAIAFDNNGEFQKSDPETIEMITACQVIIQNAIVLWNYLYLSQQLVDATAEERIILLEGIRNGSVLAWRHVNFLGAFDFTGLSANDRRFNLDEIYALSIS